ncbi:MAG: SRPBCC domain-containing protein [Planctomycetaceae bacterium]|nr:SRPBCC domain-containing protein [Planctomycetaceae bacterium]
MRIPVPATKALTTGTTRMSHDQLTAASFELDLFISVSTDRVWNAISAETSAWWPKEFVTSDRTKSFVIEPRLGGRAFEDFGNGEGLVWYTVVGMDAGRELILAGHLLPPFGGPATTALRLTLIPREHGTLLKIRDDRFGILGGEPPTEGWRTVFDDGLRRYLESGN